MCLSSDGSLDLWDTTILNHIHRMIEAKSLLVRRLPFRAVFKCSTFQLNLHSSLTVHLPILRATCSHVFYEDICWRVPYSRRGSASGECNLARESLEHHHA